MTLVNKKEEEEDVITISYGNWSKIKLKSLIILDIDLGE